MLSALALGCLAGLAPAATGRAADLDHWARCMGGSGASEAVRACSAILASGKEPAEDLPYAYVYRGNAHAALKQSEQAEQDFTAALKLPSPPAHAHYGLALLYKARQDWPRAIAEFSKTIDSPAEDADIDAFTADSEGSLRAAALAERGYALMKSGDPKHSFVDFDAAAGLCPTCSAPWRSRAQALDALGQGAEALSAADQAIARNMRSSPAFLVRGLVKAHLGRYPQAVADYSEAIRLAPGYDLPYLMRGLAYGKLGQKTLAAADDKTLALLERGSAEALAGDPLPSDPAIAKAAAGPALDDAALTVLLAGKTWQARQGPWAATLEFRADGTFRQHSRDQSAGSTLEVERDGNWAVSRGQLCLFTNLGLCLTGHVAGDTIVLLRGDALGAASLQVTGGALEYVGRTQDLKAPDPGSASAPIGEFPIEEVFLPAPPGIPARGGKTLFYYIHGFDGRARAHSPLPEYFVTQFQKSLGWDVIDGDYPRSGVTSIMRYSASNYGAATYLARRLKALKAQGYRRIYVGGQSWGGWTSLALAAMRDLPVDGIVLIVPACCGWRATGANTDDPNFANNKLYFDQMVPQARYPMVGVFFEGDQYEPADRGKGAAEALTWRAIPNLIIDHPPGFSGHGSAWFPAFDYEYGSCIAAFLMAPRTARCPGRVIAKSGPGDFRVMLVKAQLGDRLSQAATLAALQGRHFAVYPAGDVRTIAAADRTEVKGYGMGDSVFASSFKDDVYCVRERVKWDQPQTTDESCARLIKWSDHALLALDPQSGAIVQWWVEQP